MCFLNFVAFLLFSTCYLGYSLAVPQCDLVNRTIPGLDKICGYEYTAKFDFDSHFSSASRAVTSLKNILGNCSETVETMICSLFVPRCTEEIRGPYLPCRAVCHDYATKCQTVIAEKGLEWTVAMCDILPEKDNPDTTKGYRERCFTPPNFKNSATSYAHNCSDIVVPACQGIPGYTKTVVSEEVQRKYSDWIRRKINYNPLRHNCSKPRKEIICAENLPACVDSTAAFLCRDNCYKFFNACTSPFFYGKDMCIEFPKRGDTPKDSVICKQNHWPRTENWKLSEKPTKGPTVTINASVKSGPTKTPSDKTATDDVYHGGIQTTEKTDNVQPPGMHVRGDGERKQSSSNKLIVGLVVTFIILLLIAIGMIGLLWYRRKRSQQFEYHKQVLYSDDKAEEFEVFT